jgi:formate hydrogenlyase transcriptional activator
VAATNRDLAQMVADGKFRNDLYYRLNVFPIMLPPVRERRDDIPRLVRHFTDKFARRMGRRIETIPAEALDALVDYPWPGNVRELENVIERAVILSAGTVLHVDSAELKDRGQKSEDRGQKSEVRSQSSDILTSDLRPLTAGPTSGSMADAEREHILAALRTSNWVVGGPNGAAARLAMKRTTLQSKMKKLGISIRP